MVAETAIEPSVMASANQTLHTLNVSETSKPVLPGFGIMALTHTYWRAWLSYMPAQAK